MEQHDNHLDSDADIWLSLFTGQPEVEIPRFATVFNEGDTASFVYVIVDGAVIELKGDRSHGGHLVTLCKRGDIIGIRVQSTLNSTHTVRAVTLTPATIRVMKRDRFMQAITKHPDLFTALSICLSKRQRFTQLLEDSCSGSSLRAHLEYILGEVARTYGMDQHHAAVPVPEDVLVEMVGCPKPLLDTYLKYLISNGTVDIDQEGIRLRSL